MAGRYAEFVIYPFSFSEFTDMYQTVRNDSMTPEIFKRYVTLGGMPFLANLDLRDAPSMQYLKDVYNSVVLKDVVKRNNIRDVDLLERIVIYVLANIGKTFSATSISKYLKNEKRNVSPETVLSYIKACEEAFLFYRVKRRDLVGKKLLSVSEKYYVADHGLREAIYGKNQRDIEIVLENIVYFELLRRGYQVTVGKIDVAEVDFVAERNGELIYVQVAYMLASESTIEREFGSLEKVGDNFPKYVVSMDEFDMSRNGIKHFNVREFLSGNPGL
jgi:predicted AAA+ superfamily ATPase